MNKIFFLAFQPIFRLPYLFRCPRKSKLFPPVRFLQQFVYKGRVFGQLLFKRDAIRICSEESFFFTTMNQFELKKKENKLSALALLQLNSKACRVRSALVYILKAREIKLYNIITRGSLHYIHN